MDPITHALFGATMGRAGLNRKSGYATLTLAMAAEFPDIDVVLNLFDDVTAFGHHRGFTHTLLGAPLMAACVVAIVYGIHRWRVRRGKSTRLPPDWKWLYGFSLLGVLSHILLDFTNNYGVRPFAPFHPKWYAWDIVFIIEPVMYLLFFMAFVMPMLAGLIGGEIGERKKQFRGRGAAIAALVLIGCLWIFRDMQHRVALEMLDSQVYGGHEPIRVAANPYYLNPFKWHGVVETETAFRTLTVDTWSKELDEWRDAQVFYKPEETEFTLAAKKSRLGRFYLDWARFPLVETETDPATGLTEVRMRDLRFAYPERDGVVLGTTYVIAPDKQVVEEYVGEKPVD